MISKHKQMAQYMAGKRDGSADFKLGQEANGHREWSAAYRKGYSDGWWSARGRPKKY